MKNGEPEKLLYVVTIQPNAEEPHGDYLATVDVDPDSPTFSSVIHRTFTNRTGNELHHSGWNACSSCYKVPDGTPADEIPQRNKLVLPGLHSNRIYVFSVEKDLRKPVISQEIDGQVFLDHDVSAPHTTHCLADGTVMISTMGDAAGNAKGEFILFDSKTFECKGTWTRGEKKARCGYDFWYQPHFDVLVASEWAAPKLFSRGWRDEDAKSLEYGHSLNVYRYSDRTLIQTIDLGLDGFTPLEIRFLHDPKKAVGFVGCALFSKVFRFYRPDEGKEEFVAEKVIDIPNKVVREDCEERPVGGMMSDILISLDDKWLYVSNWRHGDIRQYDITDTARPVLKGQLFIGGIANLKPGAEIVEDKELDYVPKPRVVNGRRLEGGPQMFQLSLDGKRLYASSSLYSPWDKQVRRQRNGDSFRSLLNPRSPSFQFYPEMVKAGGFIVRVDVDNVNGGLQLNESFFVDFGNEPYGPALPHEMRYPGGDCSSDIWLADD